MQKVFHGVAPFSSSVCRVANARPRVKNKMNAHRARSWYSAVHLPFGNQGGPDTTGSLPLFGMEKTVTRSQGKTLIFSFHNLLISNFGLRLPF